MSVRQVVIALDQLLNAALGGWADETLSSRAWREDRKTLVAILDALAFWESEHCRSSYINEQKRKHLPPELRV